MSSFHTQPVQVIFARENSRLKSSTEHFFSVLLILKCIFQNFPTFQILRKITD